MKQELGKKRYPVEGDGGEGGSIPPFICNNPLENHDIDSNPLMRLPSHLHVLIVT